MKRLTTEEHQYLKENCYKSMPELCVEMNRNKSTLSYWLKYYREETGNTQKTEIYLRRNRDEYLKDTNEKMDLEALEFSTSIFEKNKHDLLFMAGLALYWAEGTKGALGFSNGDIKMIALMTNWINCYFVGIKLRLRLYVPVERIESATKFWSNELDLSQYVDFKAYNSIRNVRLENGVVTIQMSGMNVARRKITILLELYKNHLLELSQVAIMT